MSTILFQVKASCESAQRSMESLMQKKQEPVTEKEKRSIVTPDVEVTILRNANLDLESQLRRTEGILHSMEESEVDLHHSMESAIATKQALLERFSENHTENHNEKAEEEEVADNAASQEGVKEVPNKSVVAELIEGVNALNGFVTEWMKQRDSSSNETAITQEEPSKEGESQSHGDDGSKIQEEVKRVLELSTLCEKSMKEMASACEGMKAEKAALLRSTRQALEEEKQMAERLKQRMGQKTAKQSAQPPKPADDAVNARVAELEKELSEKNQSVSALEKTLTEKNQSVVELQGVVAGLRAKEAECAVQKETIGQLEKEVEALHASVQKLKGKENEELLRNENRANYAEKSLEAYKKEMEAFLRDKMNVEAEKKAACEKATQLEARCGMVEAELAKANKAIQEYEASIEKFHTLDAVKNEGMLEHVKEMGELKAALVKEQSERTALQAAMADEVSRMQSQLDAMQAENQRLRTELSAKHSGEEASLRLIREGEAKIDHWRQGMENSYHQKRVMKEALKAMVEEEGAVKEALERTRRATKALERELMAREDRESAMMRKQEEGVSDEFGTFEWARKLARYVARNPARWSAFTEEVPAMPEEVAVPVIQNTIASLEWAEPQQKFLCNWIDFFAHGGMVENENRFNRAVQITDLSVDVMDGFLTLMVPYLKSGVRSEYAVQAFIKQRPMVKCDLEVIVTPISQKVDCDVVDHLDATVLHG